MALNWKVTPRLWRNSSDPSTSLRFETPTNSPSRPNGSLRYMDSWMVRYSG